MAHTDDTQGGHLAEGSPPFELPQKLTSLLLSVITDNAQDAILVLDCNGEAIVMNERFKDVWRIPLDLTRYGTGVRRRAYLQQLSMNPDAVRRLHRLMTEHPGQSYSGEVALKSGLVLTGTSRPIYDSDGILHGQLIIYQDRTDLSDAEAERNFFEAHDQTTGLLNRSTMFGTIEHRTKPQYRGKPFGLVLVDILRFSRLNDQYGNAFGDRVLERVAQVLVNTLGSRNPMCRHGEDEFMVLLDSADEAWIEDQARHVLDELSSEMVVDGVPLVLTVNAGVSIYPCDGHTANDLVSDAYIALQRAKEVGANEIVRYSAEFGRLEDERRELETQLTHAVHHGSGLELLYQPIYDLRVNELASCEVLLRWRSKVLGSVSPAVFLPYAEESGLIIPIGEWVLRHACTQATEWSRIDGGAVPVSVNVSAKQLSEPDFAVTVAKILEETGCSPFLLILELTETSIAVNPQVMARTIDGIRRLGVKVYIDDFGTGYSSLSYLKHFQVDTLKIDKSFTQAIGQSRQDDALMQTVISMAHTLGLNALAEGVETAEQLHFLVNSECDQAQGFLLNRPMNAAQITDLLTSNDTRLPSFGTS